MQDKKGYVSFVLHAHLPFIHHPESDDYLEESWLYEAISETYIPLLTNFQKLVDEGVNFRITMSMTPPLLSMLDNKLLQKKYINYLKKLIDNKKSSSKNFYLILCDSISENSENVKIQNLQDNYFKVRDLLSRCGNIISEITKEKDLLDILYSILNSKKY